MFSLALFVRDLGLRPEAHFAAAPLLGGGKSEPATVTDTTSRVRVLLVVVLSLSLACSSAPAVTGHGRCTLVYVMCHSEHAQALELAAPLSNFQVSRLGYVFKVCAWTTAALPLPSALSCFVYVLRARSSLSLTLALVIILQDAPLLLEALTHASFKHAVTPCYQRLEFLGDAVLDYYVTIDMFTKYPECGPGKMSDLRNAAVNNEMLAGKRVPSFLFLVSSSPLI